MCNSLSKNTSNSNLYTDRRLGNKHSYIKKLTQSFTNLSVKI